MLCGRWWCGLLELWHIIVEHGRCDHRGWRRSRKDLQCRKEKHSHEITHTLLDSSYATSVTNTFKNCAYFIIRKLHTLTETGGGGGGIGVLWGGGGGGISVLWGGGGRGISVLWGGGGGIGVLWGGGGGGISVLWGGGGGGISVLWGGGGIGILLTGGGGGTELDSAEVATYEEKGNENEADVFKTVLALRLLECPPYVAVEIGVKETAGEYPPYVDVEIGVEETAGKYSPYVAVEIWVEETAGKYSPYAAVEIGVKETAGEYPPYVAVGIGVRETIGKVVDCVVMTGVIAPVFSAIS